MRNPSDFSATNHTAEQIETQVRAAAEFIRDQIGDAAKVAIIAGTGLGGIAEEIQNRTVVSYDAIPNFPSSTVMSHAGEVVAGTIQGTDVVCLNGRVHMYEGQGQSDIVLPIRSLACLGVETLFVTNAAGGINRSFRRADVMVIEDHINFLGDNPLVGQNVDGWGSRFPDASDLYDRRLVEMATACARALDVDLKRGVYGSILGPNLETKAEYTMLGALGVDAIGMSTTPEVTAAKHMGLAVCGFSIITDECFPETLQPVSIDDVIAAAGVGGPRLKSIIVEMIRRIGSDAGS